MHTLFLFDIFDTVNSQKFNFTQDSLYSKSLLSPVYQCEKILAMVTGGMKVVYLSQMTIGQLEALDRPALQT